MTEQRIKALAEFLEVDADELNETSWNEQEIEYSNQSYLVVTDSEADDLWEQELDNYIDECILYELPEHYRRYFDSEKWKQDARIDGRAHSLARYDGNEDEIEIDGETFYIYRQN